MDVKCKTCNINMAYKEENHTQINQDCFNSVYLGGPVHISLFVWLFLLTVRPQWRLQGSIHGSALRTCRGGRIQSAERVAGFFLLNAASPRPVLCQHPGKVLAGAQLLHDAGSGETVWRQNMDGPLLLLRTVCRSTPLGGGSGFFEELPLPTPFHFFKVFVQERR